MLSFPGSKVISVHYSVRSTSKEGKDKGVRVYGSSVVQQESRPSLVVTPLKWSFPHQPPYFCIALPSEVIDPQRNINSFYDSCSSTDLYHDYIPTVLVLHACLRSYFSVMFDIMISGLSPDCLLVQR